ncbi:MAG: transcriptional regulator [Clostridia bacterium]|nr:transcriptional regulator [Clostridia bacterium]
MATTNEYIEYVCEQIRGVGEIRYQKMFGEFMVYINNKPIIIVCNNVPFVKKLDVIEEKMKHAEIGYPYKGAKEHYVLDIDDIEFSKTVLTELEKVTPIPKPRKKKGETKK